MRRSTLRGSVTQNTVRMRAKERSRFGFLLRLGALLGSLVLIGGATFWLWHIGWPQRQAEHLLESSLHMTAEARFSVKDIVVEGRQETPKDALTAALGVGSGTPILSFDPALAQTRIAKLPWVASVVVERRLPDTILVRLTERQPLARWQHEGRTVVIDTEGKELPEASLDQFVRLPMVVGSGAPAATSTLLNALKSFPAITEKMTAAVRVSERRWDLHLEPKTVARLPETNIEDALKRLSQLITEQKILERDILTIDLRFPDKLILEPAGSTLPHQAGDMRL